MEGYFRQTKYQNAEEGLHDAQTQLVYLQCNPIPKAQGTAWKRGGKSVNSHVSSRLDKVAAPMKSRQYLCLNKILIRASVEMAIQMEKIRQGPSLSEEPQKISDN